LIHYLTILVDQFLGGRSGHRRISQFGFSPLNIYNFCWDVRLCISTKTTLGLLPAEEDDKMQMGDARRLTQKWGDRSPCENPIFDKEYIGGSDTGDLVCTICGHYDWEHASKEPSLKKQE
jgi:hypothetical protein